MGPPCFQLPEVCGGAYVDGVPVHGERRAAQDPHRDDDHNLQEDLRRPRQAVEVSGMFQLCGMERKTKAADK